MVMPSDEARSLTDKSNQYFKNTLLEINSIFSISLVEINVFFYTHKMPY